VRWRTLRFERLGSVGSGNEGHYLVGGTSEGAPAWAGIIADFNSYAGHSLGFLNPILYALGGYKQFTDFGHDITIGNNSYAGVTGCSATLGWDLASGWGTPKLDRLPSEWFAIIQARVTGK